MLSIVIQAGGESKAWRRGIADGIGTDNPVALSDHVNGPKDKGQGERTLLPIGRRVFLAQAILVQADVNLAFGNGLENFFDGRGFSVGHARR